MKFLLINGKLYKRNSDNKIITVPDDYNNKLLRLNNHKYFVRNLYNNRGFRYSLGRSKPHEVSEIEYNKIYSYYNGIYQY